MDAGSLQLSSHARLLESIVGITQQRSQDALITVLAQSLAEQMRPDELLLVSFLEQGYEVLWRTGHPQAVLLGGAVLDHYQRALVEPVPSPLLEHWLEGNSAVFPIRHLGQISQALCITTPRLSMNDLRLISSLMRIYQNFLDLLSAKEHDRLTGLYNRSLLDEQLAGSLLGTQRQKFSGNERRQKHDRQHWLVLIDIDDFLRVNERYGHLYGDEVLILLANLMRSSFRKTDRLFRYGGDEFVVLLSQVAAESCIEVLQRFCDKVQEHPFPQGIHLSLSMGVAALAEQDLPSVVIDRADRALRWAKQRGGGRVANFSSLLAAGLISEPQAKGGGVDYF